MRDFAPSLFLLAAGAYVWWTTRSPDHANPRFARSIAGGLLTLGIGALLYSLFIGV